MQATVGYLPSMERRVNRRLFITPRDQRKLLDNADSWIENLQSRPHGLYNIPPAVLENLRKFKSSQGQQTSSPPEQPSPSQHSQPIPRVRPVSKDGEGEQVHSEAGSPARSPQGDFDIDSATQYPWEETPPRTVVPDLESRPEPPSSPLPGNERAAAAAVVASKPRLHIPPQSSPISDEEIEFKAPDALISPMGKIGKLVLAVPTPPSAQVIPSTFDKSSPVKPEFKRRRLMKVPDFDAQAKELAARQLATTTQSACDHVPARHDPKSPSIGPAVAGDLPVQEVSMIPATFRSPVSAQTTRPRGSPRSVIKEKAASGRPSQAPESDLLPSSQPGALPAPEVDLEDHTEEEMPLIPATIEQPADRQDAIRSSGIRTSSGGRPADVGLTLVPDSETNRETANAAASGRLLSPSSAKPISPYEAFTAAYPNYGGGVKHYISAAYYIRGLEKSGQLPSFLYDDVIRAFIQDYSPYVARYDSNNADSSAKPLNLITWYNLNTDTLQYTKNIVTKQNLGDILRAYPDEVADLEASITPPSSAISPLSKGTADESDPFAEEEEEEENNTSPATEAAEAAEAVVEIANAPESSLEAEVTDSQPTDVHQARYPYRDAVPSPSINQEAHSSPPIKKRARSSTPEPLDVLMRDIEEEEAEPRPTIGSSRVPTEPSPVRTQTTANPPRESQGGSVSMKPPSRAASGAKRRLDSSRPASPASSMRSIKRTETSKQRLTRWREFLTQRYQGSVPSSNMSTSDGK